MSIATARSSSSKIESLTVSAYTIPTDFPESDGTIEWDKTTIVVVRPESVGITGLGYTYADVSTAKLVDSLLRQVIEGRDVMDTTGCWMAMRKAVRNLGSVGIAAMAISAVDIALWDLKAKILGLPLLKLIGAARHSVAVYGSGGFTSYSVERLQDQLETWARSGIRMVKMKVGRDPNEDPKRVKAAREAIGGQVRLFVDANGAYTRKQALHMAEQFQNVGVTWFEEPVPSDDLEGLRFMRDRCPAGMEIAAGEYGYDALYLRRMLDAGAVDVLQADATRCGGVTGFLQASTLCAARSMPLSAHTAPMIHMPLCCAVPQAVHLEYFHDHVRIEGMLFEGTTQPVQGELKPDLARPGFGLKFCSADAEQYAAK